MRLFHVSMVPAAGRLAGLDKLSSNWELSYTLYICWGNYALAIQHNGIIFIFRAKVCLFILNTFWLLFAHVTKSVAWPQFHKLPSARPNYGVQWLRSRSHPAGRSSHETPHKPPYADPASLRQACRTVAVFHHIAVNPLLCADVIQHWSELSHRCEVVCHNKLQIKGDQSSQRGTSLRFANAKKCPQAI